MGLFLAQKTKQFTLKQINSMKKYANKLFFEQTNLKMWILIIVKEWKISGDIDDLGLKLSYLIQRRKVETSKFFFILFGREEKLP